MNNELIEAIQEKPISNKIRPYLQRREIIFTYAQACVGELAPKLESAEIENSTLTLTFKPPKQKSQISLVFGMNALVPLGTI
ncbi:hypothetical protein COL401_14820 [Helicobacter pylori]